MELRQEETEQSEMDVGNAQSSLHDEQPGFWLSGEDTWQQIHAHNLKLLNELQVGDLVRFKRGGGIYDHWAVYIGDGEVVHVTGNEETAYTSLGFLGSSKLKNAHIKRDDFWKVAQISWAVNSNFDNINCPLPGEEIKQKALDCVGPVNYTLTERNCEHFAKQCRYGQASRNQADGLMYGLKYATPLCVCFVLVAYALVEMISDEFKAYAVLVMSVLVAGIPFAKAGDRIRMLCLFTVVVVSGVIGHVLAANIVTASIVVTVSVVSAVIKGNYFPEPSAVVWVDMIIAGATVAMGAVDAASGVFGKRIFPTACTLSAAFAVIIPNDISCICLTSVAILTNAMHSVPVQFTCVIEFFALLIISIIPEKVIDVTKTPARFLAVCLLVFTASFLVRRMFSSINMTDQVQLNMVCILSLWSLNTGNVLVFKIRSRVLLLNVCGLIELRMYREIDRFLFLSTLIMHWLHYDTQVSQVMDLSVLGDITDTAMNGTGQCYAP